VKEKDTGGFVRLRNGESKSVGGDFDRDYYLDCDYEKDSKGRKTGKLVLILCDKQTGGGRWKMLNDGGDYVRFQGEKGVRTIFWQMN